MKNKDRRHKRNVDKKMFSKKLGGTHNDQKNHTKDKNKHKKNVKKMKWKINE